MIPSIGRIVTYVLTEQDVRAIEGLSGRKNLPRSGDEYPAMIVRVWGPGETAAANLQVFYDGDGSYWATSRYQGDEPGTWRQPARVGA